MKIVIFESEPWERPTFAGLGRAHTLVYVDEKLNPRTADSHADADIISTFIYSALDCDTLQRFKQLKLIATRSTGFDHIDPALCKERGVKIANVPGYGENTVAEHVFGLLLAISHRLVEAVDRTRRGDFSLNGLCGFDLCGKTMGIVGAGAIGKHTARIAKGFGMNVVACDVAPNAAAAKEIGYDYLEFDALLRRSDVVSLHVPADDSTKHMISGREFELMKDGVVLINTARGSVIDVRSLLGALASGKVAAAGLDVLPEEPVIREEAELLRSVFSKKHDLESLLADHILLRLRNVLITPHSAFNTREAVQRILDTTRANIDAFIAGKSQNIVS